MRITGLSKRMAAVLGVVIALVVATTALATNAPVQAQLATDFTLSVGSGNLPPTGGSSDVVVAISPGESAIAAVGATVTYDASQVQPLTCTALVGLGACNTEIDGVINVQTVDPSGWAIDTDLFRITFQGVALSADAPLTATVTEAYDVSGTLIAGSVANGTLDLELNGDVDCDQVRTIADALFIAQYIVGLRTTDTCPLGTPATQIDLTNADANRDGQLDLGDAIRVAQCTVGLVDCDA